jgi:hypothetical protein
MDIYSQYDHHIPAASHSKRIFLDYGAGSCCARTKHSTSAHTLLSSSISRTFPIHTYLGTSLKPISLHRTSSRLEASSIHDQFWHASCPLPEGDRGQATVSPRGPPPCLLVTSIDTARWSQRLTSPSTSPCKPIFEVNAASWTRYGLPIMRCASPRILQMSSLQRPLSHFTSLETMLPPSRSSLPHPPRRQWAILTPYAASDRARWTPCLICSTRPLSSVSM